jgi:hypothetical protein
MKGTVISVLSRRQVLHGAVIESYQKAQEAAKLAK